MTIVDWRETARQMKREGHGATEISRLLGISRGKVRTLLEPRFGGRGDDDLPIRFAGADHPGRRAKPGQGVIGKHGYIPTVRHVGGVRKPRKARRIIAEPATILAAARAFNDANREAPGSMPVAALMKMISVGETL